MTFNAAEQYQSQIRTIHRRLPEANSRRWLTMPIATFLRTSKILPTS
jgi:hypothetical protein